MWLEFAISSFCVAFWIFLEIWCDSCSPSVILAPRTIGTLIASLSLLESTRLQIAGIFFACSLQFPWGETIPLFISLGLIGWEISHDPRYEVPSVIISLVSLGFIGIYGLMKAFGVDNDITFVPLIFAFLGSIWMWSIWFNSFRHKTFPIFVLIGMTTLLIQMALTLVPEPPLKPVQSLSVPLAFYISPPFYVVYRHQIKNSL